MGLWPLVCPFLPTDGVLHVGSVIGLLLSVRGTEQDFTPWTFDRKSHFVSPLSEGVGTVGTDRTDCLQEAP